MRKALIIVALTLLTAPLATAQEDAPGSLDSSFSAVQSILQKYCLDCHSQSERQGELDLERFQSLALVREDLKPWQAMIQQLETREMPPREEPQPSDTQRQQLLDWVKQVLKAEAIARAGDPGSVPLHRLSNTEYNHTIRDLTGVDLQPAADFPADGAAGEGFTNAAEALNMSPALMAKYLKASKEVAQHAVLLPSGFRFSPSSTRRDWTDESLEALRAFYRQFTADGELPIKPYLVALIRHRDDLRSGRLTTSGVAEQHGLSPKYAQLLWQALEADAPSYPLDRLRTQWREARESDVDAMAAEITSWSERLWETQRIGSYVHDQRHTAKDPPIADSHTLRVQLQPVPGQSEVVLYLVARQLGGPPTQVRWQRPRFEREAAGSTPLLLQDYPQYGPRYEVDYADLFATTSAYLAAVAESAHDPELALADLAAKHKIDTAWLERWIRVADLQPLGAPTKEPKPPGRPVPPVVWQLLDTPAPIAGRPAIQGWRPAGGELPIVISNRSDQIEHIPGRISPHRVAVHPMPTESVAVLWNSPINGTVRIGAAVEHAHPACGNGVAWWLEKQSPARSAILAEGAVDLGNSTQLAPQVVEVAIGDQIVLGVSARVASHVCDLTEVTLTISEIGDAQRVWDLSGDVADDIDAANPHADRQGNSGVWQFVRGPTANRALESSQATDTDSTFARWRAAAADPALAEQARELAEQIQTLLSGPRPTDENASDQAVYDRLVSSGGALLQGIELTRFHKPVAEHPFALPPQRFGVHPQGRSIAATDLMVASDEVLEIRLPADLFRDHAFVVDGTLEADADQAVVQLYVLTDPPADTGPAGAALDPGAPVVAVAEGPGQQGLLAGLAEYRSLFPPTICYPHIIPLDEVVCLKTFHREDQELIRLFLDEDQTQQLNHLWEEHRFITKFPLVENEYLPLFIGFVTQDQPQETLELFEGMRPDFLARAEAFQRDFTAAAPQQLQQLSEFASRAYRRPLSQSEQDALRQLYQSLCQEGVAHEDALRSLLSRILISPSFLLHLEQAPAGSEAAPVDDWELAARLSYFLWSSIPDEPLRQLTAEQRLHQPQVLAEQTRRMLSDERARALAVEFGTQWIHVRGFDQFNEKNETLFPSFDAELRQAMYEESILFFQNLFGSDVPVTDILDADYTFLNQALAEHYGIPGIEGDAWRRVEGVKRYGRGGILGLASVQSKQAGASRTSPVLRGNWVVETLLGEKLPQPPPNIPQLPETETGNGGLTTRQIVEQHVSAAECAICHQRIDPFGFAFEQFDPIGRRRKVDSGGLPLDDKATLRDGTQFEGIEGLRNYLLTQKRETILRKFCQRLLGYALGRSVTISDQLLIDEMMTEINAGNTSTAALVLKIVQSPQFQTIRGTDFTEP